MKLPFGITIAKSSMVPVPSRSSSSWFSVIRESFAGAWQKNIEVESKENLLAFSAVYACIVLIADDISKLRIKLMRYTDDIWQEVESGSPFLPVFRKPNKFQTRLQFLSNWMTSKLMYGNAYIIKQRDNRGVVTSLYVLDPRLVVPLVTDTGDVYYQLNRDPLAEIPRPVAGVPASEVIHDRAVTLWHPLVGVSPISACAYSATQGIKIQGNSAKFFANQSRPSGQLTAPGPISDDNAARLKAEFEANFSGENIGRLLVTGDGLKYEPMSIPANDAQLIEQLRWTVEDVSRCFKIPLYKLGIGQPALSNIGALNQEYYSQALQTHIESIESLLDEGLNLPTDLGTEIDLEGLLRMDPIGRATRAEILLRSGMLAPNEGRRNEDLPPVTGGDSPLMQQQNYSLAALAKRDAREDPFSPAPPPAPPMPPGAPATEDGTPAAAAATGEVPLGNSEPVPSKESLTAFPSIEAKADELEVANHFADLLIAKFSTADATA